ncbi:hypothetical protein [Streptomyces sp. BRA346]
MQIVRLKAVLRQDPDGGDTAPDTDEPTPPSGGGCGDGDGCGRR